nr:MAG TPA: induced Fungus-induced protein [Caudoviricetes sp.]
MGYYPTLKSNFYNLFVFIIMLFLSAFMRV